MLSKGHHWVLAYLFAAACSALLGCPNGDAGKEGFIVTPGELDFGQGQSALTFEVCASASGGAGQSFTVAASQAWMEVEPASGVTSGPEERKSIAVRLDRSRMALGNYTGTVTIRANGETQGKVTVRAQSVVRPNFTANATFAYTGGVVQFREQVEVAQGYGAVTSWLWDFGDGTTSAEGNPSHSYAESGVYTVSLTVAAGALSVTQVRRDYISIGARRAPAAKMEVSARSALVDERVRFTDRSDAGSAPITRWLWSFGDGGTSTAQHPSYTYSEPGTYSISLTVESAHGSNTAVLGDYLTVRTVAPVAAFRADARVVQVNTAVPFVDLSTAGTSPITSWRWDFGDGGTSVEQNPTHTYTMAGAYTVSLQVDSAHGGNTRVEESYISVGAVAPAADFLVDVRSPYVNTAVHFSDRSKAGTAPITRWAWTFGDGGTSAEQHPAHTYTTAGAYTVSLTVETEHGTHTTQKSEYINVQYRPPAAAFSVSTVSTFTGDEVAFVDGSTAGTAPVTGWLWYFGDGGTSTQQHPTHTYANAGLYTVRLTAQSAHGDDVEEKANLITVKAKVGPAAEFEASDTNPGEGIAVQFGDLSEAGSAAITSWRWNFGDGSPRSTEQHPSHAYANPGTYTVSLTVVTEHGADTNEKVGYIAVRATEAPAADFEAASQTTYVGDALEFTDLSAAGTAPITQWEWQFGDGTANETVRNPIHTYTAVGTYTVTLRVWTAHGNDAITKTDYVTVLNAVQPAADFEASNRDPLVNATVQFTDLSEAGSAPITSWRWDFGDGTPISTERNPAHSYAEGGPKNVTLTVQTAHGEDTITKGGYVRVRDPNIPEPPTADFDTLDRNPVAGQEVQFVDLSDQGTRPITSWVWSFGDGSEPSVERNPAHVFDRVGAYTIRLSVTTPLGSNTAVKEGFIVVRLAGEPVGPTAEFTVSDGFPYPAESVRFIDQSDPGTSPITARLWDFGDGTSSTALSPAHAYAAAGAYTVSLTVTTEHGSDTETKSRAAQVRLSSYSFEIPALDAEENATHVGRRTLDAPAGNHGFCETSGEHFVFEDGHRFRGWGTSVSYSGGFPEHAAAPLVAERLAKLGYNVVRFHHLDSTAGLFMGQANTRSFNAEVLDRLDFFINELKQRGIYSNINLHTSRTFVDADGLPYGNDTPQGGKLISLFHRGSIDLAKEHATNLLTHVNPYTGLAYVDEPAVAMVEITNENWLWNAWALGGLNTPSIRNPEGLPQFYIDYLDDDFNIWLLGKYGDRATLEAAWAGTGTGLHADEDPTLGTVGRLSPIEALTHTAARLEDLVRYYYELEANFFEEMTWFLKNTLHVKVPVLGTQIYVGMPGLLSQSKADYMDAHGYWDHPVYEGNVYSPTPNFRVNLNSWVEDPTFRASAGEIFNAGPVMAYSMSRMKGKPMTVSEWQTPSFQPYAYELPLILSAYAGFHDWDAMYSYAFAQDDGEYAAGALESVWQIANNPAHQVLSTVAALAYLRGDVTAAPEKISIHYSDADIFKNLLSKVPIVGGDTFFWWGKNVPLWAPYVVPVQRDVSLDGEDSGPLELLSQANTGRYTSTTGELVWETRSTVGAHVAINTPRFQAIVGALQDREGELANMDVNGDTAAAAVAFVSLDGATLATTTNALLVGVADETAQGEALTLDNGWYQWTPGTPPMTLEAVQATLRLKGLSEPGRVRIYPLDASGNRMEAAAVQLSSGIVEFVLGVHPTPWYELVVE